MIKLAYVVSAFVVVGALAVIAYLRSYAYMVSHPQWMAGFESQIYMAALLGLIAVCWSLYAIISRQIFYAWLPSVILGIFLIVTIYLFSLNNYS